MKECRRTVGEVITELQTYEPESLLDVFEDEETVGIKIICPSTGREVGQIDLCA